ncbi:hypothetical protein FisN_11Hh274 [Fistulifera solaris]|uniref:Rhodanese domain-containing protein n=1 Tax=Fistulifera solaris TaxID=1519565 RepID=A0A1Z5JLS4_FISSO|nr:hypothetical protein FisN_11Hh274 [Fistulifera solaris]|eukprot:GAX14731.1 hypothetical protein FisN_11Hh274 [Fistulifera solaris]
MKLLIASLLPLAHGVVTELSTQQLFEGIQENKFQVIVDVRSQAEFDAGHIEGATLLENLFYFGMGSLESASPADLEGCELCHIAVYDRSGGRTINAIEILEEAGFMNLYNGQGTSQWTSAGYSLVTDVSVVPPCTTDPAAQEQCSALEEAPTTSPTVNDPTAIRSLDAAQFVQLRNQGMFDVILDVREETSGGHITGATLIGPLSEEILLDLEGCAYCNIAIYGEGAEDAADLLVENGFNGRLYFGPSVEEYSDAGFELSTAESVEPRCTTDTVIQEACEARWVEDGGDSGEASGSEPPSAPTPSSKEPKPSPAKDPTEEKPSETNSTAAPAAPTSDVQQFSAVLSCIIGLSIAMLL